jgi:hypothetical protein
MPSSSVIYDEVCKASWTTAKRNGNDRQVFTNIDISKLYSVLRVWPNASQPTAIDQSKQ